jgi:hypothetical protein
MAMRFSGSAQPADELKLAKGELTRALLAGEHVVVGVAEQSRGGQVPGLGPSRY